ncbi:MAG TPA: tRNA pseudouridine(38-40) synthase TruA [Ruminococcaceae bacterium]|nr:tRNA pseudouridine(38-40) synthase TruA [Oscillospiraceae bacterium]
MRNLLLWLRFKGTAYHGWQVQKNAITVQQTLQEALKKILGEQPPVTGCSRTDAGVHAFSYACNIRTKNIIPCRNLVRALNTCLPKDIAVFSCEEMHPAFHARYSASGKEYIYRICHAPQRDPFELGYAWFYPYPLEINTLKQAALQFRGTHDFSAFCAAGSSVKETVRTVSFAQIEEKEDLIIFRVRADGFLYHMVRIMVGTLIEVARGRFDLTSIPAIIDSKKRENAGPTAPAEGLYLSRILY